jgi:hypothetical protein
MNSWRSRKPRRTRLLALAIVWLATAASLGLHTGAPLRAQEAPPLSRTELPTSSATALPPPVTASARHADPLEGWLLAGVDAAVRRRGRVTASWGYVGGFDDWIMLAEGSFAANSALQLVGGHVFLRPADRRRPPTSVRRVGVNWSPLRGRVAMDNRLLIEHRSTGREASPRVRDRLRLSCAIAEASPVRLFGAIEVFAVDRRAVSERRYQAGFNAPVRHVSIEAYWLRRATHGRSPFNAIGVTLLWRIKPF